MTIEEQIQIVEDNLNEYGQSNITFEEYNFLKDELYSSGCLAGIELGRADAIEEVFGKIDKLTVYYAGDKDGNAITPKMLVKEDVIKLLEQLKEQKHE